MGASDVVTETRAGVVLRVRVTPRATRDAVTGIDERGIRVAVRAAPERGRANEAVLRAVAAWLGVAPSTLEIASGGGGRDKRVLVRGIGADDLRARVASL